GAFSSTPSMPSRAAVAGGGFDEARLKAHLHGAIHDYLIPRTIAVVQSLPKLPASDEIDMEQVRQLLEKSQEHAETPTNEVEAFILDEWRKCLGRDREVHLHSDFFDDLGGDSLTAVRIIAD
ncbi:phosphopantetheine-binding protein, partial [Staphylococcus aureus]|uniref:phosphopantetheine-binding protein n=1 Tax=Staphylococcus aureus TaxID=1280 RepID=UPI001916688B